MNDDELMIKIQSILKDKDKLNGTGVAKLKELKKLLLALQSNSIKMISASQQLIDTVDREIRRR